MHAARKRGLKHRCPRSARHFPALDDSGDESVYVRGREHISAVILYNFREPRNIFRLKSAGHETFLCCPGSNRPDAYENTGEVEMVRILRTAMPLLVLLAQPAIADDRIYPLIKYDCDT